MSQAKSPLGFGLYFIDVLACLLFSLTLALASARFDSVISVPVTLPPIETSASSVDLAPELGAQWITLREEASGSQLYLGEESITFDALAKRLAAAPPPAVVFRSESTPLSRLVALAHEAGVSDLRIAYDEIEVEEGTP